MAVELVIVSISPVPKFEPGPVSYIQFPPGPLPDAPEKLSLKTVLHPEGGGGTVTASAVLGKAANTASRPAATSVTSRRQRLTSVRALRRVVVDCEVICGSQKDPSAATTGHR